MTHSIVQRHRGYIIVVINQINQSLGGFLCSTQLELVVEMMMMMQRANARPLRDVNQPLATSQFRRDYRWTIFVVDAAYDTERK